MAGSATSGVLRATHNYTDREAKISMRKFKSVHSASVWMVLATIVLVATATFYVLGALADWRSVLVVVLVGGLLFASFWAFARVRRRREERLRYQMLHDSLTDLPNRSSFVDHVSRALSEAARESRSVAVLVVDLDDFEEINHGLGYEAGDRLLTVVGERLEVSVRPAGDMVARLCGDEFAILLEDIPDKYSAASAARQIGRR
jgi:predicted signal transduction protein with EAL and GGDEF domain